MKDLDFTELDNVTGGIAVHSVTAHATPSTQPSPFGGAAGLGGIGLGAPFGEPDPFGGALPFGAPTQASGLVAAGSAPGAFQPTTGPIGQPPIGFYDNSHPGGFGFGFGQGVPAGSPVGFAPPQGSPFAGPLGIGGIPNLGALGNLLGQFTGNPQLGQLAGSVNNIVNAFNGGNIQGGINAIGNLAGQLTHNPQIGQLVGGFGSLIGGQGGAGGLGGLGGIGNLLGGGGGFGAPTGIGGQGGGLGFGF